MRILHVLNHCNPGHGNAHVAVDLACGQARMGHAVTYASAGGGFSPLLRDNNVELAQLVLTRRDVPSVSLALARLIGICHKFRPDVLHAHMMAGAVLGYLTSKFTGIPLVNTVHNSFDEHSKLMRFSDCVVAVSQAERELLLRRGFAPDRVEVVLNGPNGSPREDFAKAEPLAPIARPSISTVCGLHARKGIEDVIRGFAVAAKAHPGWTLYVAGHGPDKEKLKELAWELGVGDNVHLLGFVSRPLELLAQSDIFVLASYAEPCSLALGEARGAGCAMVATAVGGSSEVLEHGQAGLLVPPREPAQLAGAFISLMADPAKLEAAKARSKANADHFNVDRVVREYEAVYRRVIGRRGRDKALASTTSPSAKRSAAPSGLTAL